MKKFSILASLAILACAASCSVREQEDNLPSARQYKEFYATIEQPVEAPTKTYADETLRVLWNADDRVSIFNKTTSNQQFAFSGATGDRSGTFTPVPDPLAPSGSELDEVYAVYPYLPDTEINTAGIAGLLTVSLPSRQVWKERSFGAGINTMVSYSSDDNLRFQNVGGFLVIKLYGDNVQVSEITLQGNNDEPLAGSASIVRSASGEPVVDLPADASKQILLGCESPVSIGAAADSYTEFWFVIPPTEFTKGFSITVTSPDGGTFRKKTDKPVSIGRNRISRMSPLEFVPRKPLPSSEYVDLGLPSGLKWATKNLGASRPEENGDCFAWGETAPKTEYGISNYKWYDTGSSSYTKYVTIPFYGSPVDNKTVLDLEDDAAHVILGGDWRMPTADEWKELMENCDCTWTADYNGTGVQGTVVTGKKSGYTDKSVFLPVTTWGGDTGLGQVGKFGYYWSSTTYLDYSDGAWQFLLNQPAVEMSAFFRYRGFPVRAVYGEFIPVGSLSLDKPSLDLERGDTGQLTATVTPSNATAKAVRWVSGDETVASVDENGLVTAERPGTATITAYATNGVAVSCTVTVKKKAETKGHEYVDLGLPSGLKWATTNVGASKPEEFGSLFAWGETEPKAEYSWDNYAFYEEGATPGDVCFNKYCPWDKSNYYIGSATHPDNKTVLDLADDAARSSWGGSWRMPSDAEWTELRTNCTWTWTSNYKGTGVAGMIVTGKAAGYTDKSIFLPAAGYKIGGNYNNDGVAGVYWSSSLDAGAPLAARSLYFESDGATKDTCHRDYGNSVRAVTE